MSDLDPSLSRMAAATGSDTGYLVPAAIRSERCSAEGDQEACPCPVVLTSDSGLTVRELIERTASSRAEAEVRLRRVCTLQTGVTPTGTERKRPD